MLFKNLRIKKAGDLRGDLIAGLTVGVMLIPQGMAYAMLIGLPPLYGLYASTIPLLIYALLGSSPHLGVGPVAILSLLCAQVMADQGASSPDETLALCLQLSVMSGLILGLMGLFRLGFLANFLSHPVVSGFTSAAAILIASSQLKNLLGVDLPRGMTIQEIVPPLLESLSSVHLPTLLMGGGAVLFLTLLSKAGKLGRKLPGALIAVVVSSLLVVFFKLDEIGLQTIGAVPGGLPAPVNPFGAFSGALFMELLPAAASIAFIGFVESYAIAKSVASRHSYYRIGANRELVALGAANFAGAFFQGFPVTGSFSRTAVNEQSGAKSAYSILTTVALVGLTLLFFTGLFEHLPKTVLAAIIISAVLKLIDYKEVFHLLKRDRADFVMILVTFFSTLFLGVKEGILIGVLLSMLVIVYASSRPHVAVLGRLGDSNVFRNVKRYGDAREMPELLIIRPDARIYFGNVEYLRKLLENKLAKRPGIKHVIIDASSISAVDSSAMHEFSDLILNYRLRSGIQFSFVGLIGPVRDTFQRYGFLKTLEKKHLFLNIEQAVSFHMEAKDHELREYVSQTDEQ